MIGLGGSRGLVRIPPALHWGAVYVRDREEIEYLLEPDFEAIARVSRQTIADVIPDLDITAGFTLRPTDWLAMDIYTPSFSSLDSWLLETSVTF